MSPARCLSWIQSPHRPSSLDKPSPPLPLKWPLTPYYSRVPYTPYNKKDVAPRYFTMITHILRLDPGIFCIHREHPQCHHYPPECLFSSLPLFDKHENEAEKAIGKRQFGIRIRNVGENWSNTLEDNFSRFENFRYLIQVWLGSIRSADSFWREKGINLWKMESSWNVLDLSRKRIDSFRKIYSMQEENV